ncbi:MAG: ATP-binding protein [Candidatus Limisoma sp.]
MKIITRSYYARKVDEWLGRNQIIVIVGQRRVGKSYVMKDFIARHSKEADTNIIYIDKEKREFKHILNCDDLDAYIDARISADKHNYILIDEVQEIAGWEKSVRSFRSEDNTDVIVTGSNSKMLSGELSTLLSGRCEEILIQPLSYNEFLEFHQLADSDDSLWKYMNYGGLPGLINISLDREDMVEEYMSGLYNTIMLKDVIERHNIRNIPFLHNLLKYLADTTGKLNSATNIAKYMKQKDMDISTNIVLNYSSFFRESYLTSTVGRYDIHGKKLLDTAGKTYFGDVGLRNYIAGGERDKDIEKILENIVYQHLIHLGYKVYVGQLRAGEIDFVCTRSGERIYVQVAWIIADEATRKREFGALEKIDDAYPKYVISATPLIHNSDYEGIKHIHIRRFLTTGL